MENGNVKIEGKINGNESEIYLNGKKLSLAKSLKYRNHSPTGFNWGYGGSGPAQTALAILLEYAGPQKAQDYYQAFKWQFVATWPFDENFCVQIDLGGWLFSQEKYQAERYASRYDFTLDDTGQIIDIKEI